MYEKQPVDWTLLVFWTLIIIALFAAVSWFNGCDANHHAPANKYYVYISPDPYTPAAAVQPKIRRGDYYRRIPRNDGTGIDDVRFFYACQHDQKHQSDSSLAIWPGCGFIVDKVPNDKGI
jgi:hypothetical protein